MQNDIVNANLLYLWLGFSLAFVLLVSLWVFIQFDAKDGSSRLERPPKWRQLAARTLLVLFLGSGALASAAASSAQWTSYSLWVGIVVAFWVVIGCFGDLRIWGKKQ